MMLCCREAWILPSGMNFFTEIKIPNDGFHTLTPNVSNNASNLCRWLLTGLAGKCIKFEV